LNLLAVSLLLSVAMLLGRIAGFVRDVQIGSLYGLSAKSDLAIVLLTTPDLLVNVLLAGGLSMALIPELQRRDTVARTKLAGSALFSIALAFSLLACLIAAFPAVLLALLAPSYAEAPPEGFVSAMRISAVAIPLAGLTGVTTALLQSENKFFVAGLGTLMFNATIIALLAFFATGESIFVLGWAVAIAAFVRFASQLWVARAQLFSKAISIFGGVDRALLNRFGNALTATTITVLVPVAIRSVVSSAGEGNLAAFNFATKLLDLPVGVVIAAISATAFPVLAQHFNKGDEQAVAAVFRSTIQKSLAAAIAIMIPAIWFAEPIVSTVYDYGRMEQQDVIQIAGLAQIALASLPFVAISTVCTSLLSARLETSRVLKLTVMSTFILPLCLIASGLSGHLSAFAAALPAFHLTLAIVLLIATRYPIFRGGWVRWAFLKDIGGAMAVTSAAIMLAAQLPDPSPYLLTAIALAAICLSLLITYRSSLSRLS
jgi:putative peptidoglycan lipid II flippase